MPKKVITTQRTEETIDPNQVQNQDEDLETAEPVLSQAEKELLEFFETVGGSANMIRIYKMVSGEAQFCGSAEPSVVSPEYILANYGGGKFRLTAFMNGKFISGGTKYLTIYQPPVDPLKSLPSAVKLPETGGEISLLREQINRQHEMLLQMLQQNQKSGGLGDMNILQIMQLVKELQPKQADITTILPNIMDLFKSTMETAKEAAGASDGKTDWAGLIGKAIQTLPGVIGGVAAMKQQQPSAYNPPAEQPMQDAGAALLQAIASCKPYALKGTDPALIVDWISANMDSADPTYRQLALAILNMPYEDIQKADRDLEREPLKSWFRKLYDGLRELAGDEQTPEITTGANGSGTDSK